MSGVVVNNEEYAWGDMNVVLLGKNIAGLTAIKYKESQSKDLRYAKGVEPVGFKRGNKKYEGSITVLHSELIALCSASPNGTPLDLRNIDIVFSYGDQETGVLHTKVAKFVEFTEFEEGWKQGDSSMEIELPFICLGVKKA